MILIRVFICNIQECFMIRNSIFIFHSYPPQKLTHVLGRSRNVNFIRVRIHTLKTNISMIPEVSSVFVSYSVWTRLPISILNMVMVSNKIFVFHLMISYFSLPNVTLRFYCRNLLLSNSF